MAVQPVLQVFERRQSIARAVSQGLRSAGLRLISTEFVDNHIAATKSFLEQATQAA